MTVTAESDRTKTPCFFFVNLNLGCTAVTDGGKVAEQNIFSNGFNHLFSLSHCIHFKNALYFHAFDYQGNPSVNQNEKWKEI